jgi:hypothetical protein
MVEKDHRKQLTGAVREMLAQVRVKGFLSLFLRSPGVVAPPWKFAPHKLKRPFNESAIRAVGKSTNH